MERLTKFRSLSTHAWYSRLWEKLSKDEVSTLEEWIKDRQALATAEYAGACNRNLLRDHKDSILELFSLKKALIANELLLVSK